MPKGLSRSSAHYNDVKPIMDAALERPGLIYELKSINQAHHFRQKCYKYRTFLRDLEEERVGNIPGHAVTIAYDILVIRFTRKDEGEKFSRFLQFDHNSTGPGRLIDPDTGQEIKIDTDAPQGGVIE